MAIFALGFALAVAIFGIMFHLFSVIDVAAGFIIGLAAYFLNSLRK